MTCILKRRVHTSMTCLLLFLIACQLIVTYYIITRAKELSIFTNWKQNHMNGNVQTIVTDSTRVKLGVEYKFWLNSKNSFKSDLHNNYRVAKIRFRPNLQDPSPPSHPVLNIAPYNEFTYETFQPKEPNFILTEDRRKFYTVKINRELMRPIPKSKLTGVVEVIRDGTFHLPNDCGWASSNKSFLDQSQHPDVSADFLCPLIIPDGWAFQSFMDSTLPKIMQVYELLRHPSMKILLEEPRDAIIYEILDKLGIRRKQLIFQKRNLSIVYRAKYMLFTCITPPLHPALWKRARAALGVSEVLSTARKDAKIIVLSRRFASNAGRKITNMSDLLAMLQTRYGDNSVLVYDGHYNLTSTIDFFKQARLIIGVHGGAFYNMNFAPSDTALIEISPSDETGLPVPRSLGHTIFWTMSTLLKQTYWRIYHTTDNLYSNMQLNLDILQLVLDKVDVQWTQGSK